MSQNNQRDQLSGKWKQFIGDIKIKWGKLTDDEMMEINGNREVLAGKIQEKYGIAREQANKQIDEWAKEHDGALTAAVSETRDALNKEVKTMTNNDQWDQVAGKWKQFVGDIKIKWGKLTDDELLEINGNREVLAGKIQEKYGVAKEQAHKQIDEWAKALKK